MTLVLLYLLSGLTFFLGVVYWCIIIDVILSWVSLTGLHIVIGPLSNITRPLYDLVRKYLPTTIGAIDFAPIILIILIDAINHILLPSLITYLQSPS